MSKGKFAPGKRVLLVESVNKSLRHLLGSVHTLGEPSPYYQSSWRMAPNIYNTLGKIASWAEDHMVLIDPDETPEQSVEAMRRLHDTTAPAKAKAPAVVRPFKWEAL